MGPDFNADAKRLFVKSNRDKKKIFIINPNNNDI